MKLLVGELYQQVGEKLPPVFADHRPVQRARNDFEMLPTHCVSFTQTRVRDHASRSTLPGTPYSRSSSERDPQIVEHHTRVFTRRGVIAFGVLIPAEQALCGALLSGC